MKIEELTALLETAAKTGAHSVRARGGDRIEVLRVHFRSGARPAALVVTHPVPPTTLEAAEGAVARAADPDVAAAQEYLCVCGHDLEAHINGGGCTDCVRAGVEENRCVMRTKEDNETLPEER